MAHVTVPHGEAVRGGEIFDHHFGVNYISVKDEAAGGGALPAYQNAVNDLSGSGAISVRFPGGGVSEDKVNPEAYNVLDDIVVEPGTHTYEFLRDAAANGWSVSIVLPTWRFLDPATMAVDATSARQQVALYAQSLFGAADDLGVQIDGFEIGNEFDLLAEKLDPETRLNADEMQAFSNAYAEIAAAITLALDNQIKAAGYAPADEPWIGVQALWTWVPRNWRKAVDFREAMAAAFEAAGATDAVDALLTHVYPWLELERNPQDWLVGDTTIIDNLAALGEIFGGDVDWNVTEWEVSFGSGDAIDRLRDHYDGIKQLEPLVSLFSQMVSAGIDHMNLWPVRNGCFTSLETLEGAEKPASYLFDLMQDQLTGTSVLDLNGAATGNMWETGDDVHVYGFGAEDRVLFYMGSRSDAGQALDLDLSAWRGDGRMPLVEVTRISVDDPDAKGYLQGTHVETQEYGFRWFQSHAEEVLTFSPYEMIVVEVVYETAPGEVEIGTAGNDFLFGSTGADVLRGTRGDDLIHGRFGADQLFGGAGNDVIDGGSQADTITAGLGDDVVRGGPGRDLVMLGAGDDTFIDNGQGRYYGNDVVRGGAGEDRFEIGNGDDTITGGPGRDRFVFGSVSHRIGENTITDFTLGEDVLVINGRAFTTLERLAAAHKVFADGGNTIIKVGGAGWITLEGVDSNGVAGVQQAPERVQITGSQGADSYLGGTPFDAELNGMRGADVLYGRQGDDVLRGGWGNDWLYGGAGDDVIYDGKGVDDLIGGEGADVFFLRHDGFKDRICDFEQGSDVIDLSEWGVGGPGGLDISTRGRAWMRIEAQGEEVLVHVGDNSDFAFAAEDFLF
ncbi:MAG: hypothetical protein CSA74_11670 [Rhodobacterales bacterium]|nr:MAG: hypothetical protein CSA74_11670 [Rhodobacterales bacterium]